MATATVYEADGKTFEISKQSDKWLAERRDGIMKTIAMATKPNVGDMTNLIKITEEMQKRGK